MIWIAVLVCLLISFVFSGIEAGILSVNRVRLRHQFKMHDRAAIKLQSLLARPERLLVTVLSVTNLMNICAVTLAVQEIVRHAEKMGYALAFFICLPVYLVGLEMLPKSIFRRFPYRALAALSEPLRLADLLLSPFLAVGAQIAKVILRKTERTERKLFIGREDFKYLTIESERTGTLTKVEREMIHNIVDFRGLAAREVMVPMSKAQFVQADKPVADALAISQNAQLDWLPILSPSGEIVGLVNIFEILVENGGPLQPLTTYQRRIVTVSPDEPAYSVLRKLRAARTTVAAVIDSDGKPHGIVAIPDLVKRLVSAAAA